MQIEGKKRAGGGCRWLLCRFCFVDSRIWLNLPLLSQNLQKRQIFRQKLPVWGGVNTTGCHPWLFMFDHFVVIWRRWVDIKALADKENPEGLQHE